MSAELKTVGSYNTPAEADLARLHLQSGGIRAFLADDQTIGWLWHLGCALNGIKVMVAESDLTQATELLEETTHPTGEYDRVAPWTCAHCGVEVNAGFDICWSCGTTIDGKLDPNFTPAYKLSDKDRAQVQRRQRAPAPMVALLFGFVIPVIILNAFLGVNYLLVYPLPATFSLTAWLLLGMCEFLAVVAIFQWWYYQTPSEIVEIPEDHPETTLHGTEIGNGENKIVSVVRRASLAAVLGVAFIPILLNLYSLWLILKHKLYHREVVGRKIRVIYLALLLDICVIACWLFLFLLSGGLNSVP